MAPIPDGVPLLPDTYSARPHDSSSVLDVLLSRTADGAKQKKVLAHGMGECVSARRGAHQRLVASGLMFVSLARLLGASS